MIQFPLTKLHYFPTTVKSVVFKVDAAMAVVSEVSDLAIIRYFAALSILFCCWHLYVLFGAAEAFIKLKTFQSNANRPFADRRTAL